MTMDPSWREIYRAALVEVQHEALRFRIDAAEKAIYQRSKELKQTDGDSSEEQQEMADAVRALRLLAQTECQPQHSSTVAVPQSDVAS